MWYDYIHILFTYIITYTCCLGWKPPLLLHSNSSSGPTGHKWRQRGTPWLAMKRLYTGWNDQSLTPGSWDVHPLRYWEWPILNDQKLSEISMLHDSLNSQQLKLVFFWPVVHGLSENQQLIATCWSGVCRYCGNGRLKFPTAGAQAELMVKEISQLHQESLSCTAPTDSGWDLLGLGMVHNG